MAKLNVSKVFDVPVDGILEKYKRMLDKGLITEEQYQAKSNKLLGL